VFFYHEGAYNGLGGMAPPEDERQLIRRWSELAAEHGIDLVVCVSAAARRGLAEPVEAERHSGLVSEGFRLAGLGLWVEACLKADRYLSFGN
jgi:tRNA 2-thiouridine synthesizing protein D